MDSPLNYIPLPPLLSPSPLLCTTEEHYSTWMLNKPKPKTFGESRRTTSADVNNEHLLNSSEDLTNSCKHSNWEQIVTNSNSDHSYFTLMS